MSLTTGATSEVHLDRGVGWVVRWVGRMGSNGEGPEVVQIDPTTVAWRGRELTYFGGSDYFRLSWNREVRRSIRRAVDTLGPNVSASRTTTGNHPLYAVLERDLARMFRFPSALLTSSGYLAPLVAGRGLAGGAGHVYLAATAHGCLRDAADLLGLPQTEFASVGSLQEQLHRPGKHSSPLVMTNGLSPLDGSLAPVSDLLSILPEAGWLLVDDAHGVGTLGRHGRGILEVQGVRDPRVILTGTLSKAFGCYGGFVLGSKAFRERVVGQGRFFQGNTPPPLPWVDGARTALRMIQEQGEGWRRTLAARIQQVRAVFPDSDPRRKAPGPTFVLVPKDPRATRCIQRELLRAGIYPSWIRYAQGPADRFFRFAMSSAHNVRQVSILHDAVSKCLPWCRSD